MKVVYTHKATKHQIKGHPEFPQRAKLIYQALREKRKFEFVAGEKAEREGILKVHARSLVDSVENNTFVKCQS